MYSVSDVAEMLNVNEETIRRWIRDGKLHAKRAVGRGGNTLFLDDIIAFANRPPRTYLLFLETWLTENGIAYERVEDSYEKSDDDAATVTTAAGAGIAATAIGAGIATTTTGALTSALLGPLGLGIAAAVGTVCGAGPSMMMKRKYSIQLVNPKTTEDDDSTVLSLPNAACISDVDESTAAERSDPREIVAGANDDSIDHHEVSPVAGPLNVLNEIAYAKQLLDSGILTEKEFADIKARLIARI